MTDQERWTLDRIQQTLTGGGNITLDDGQWLIDRLKSADSVRAPQATCMQCETLLFCPSCGTPALSDSVRATQDTELDAAWQRLRATADTPNLKLLVAQIERSLNSDSVRASTSAESERPSNQALMTRAIEMADRLVVPNPVGRDVQFIYEQLQHVRMYSARKPASSASAETPAATLDVTELWRQQMYQRLDRDVFYRFLADETVSSWDDTRQEIAAVKAVAERVAALLRSETPAQKDK